MADAPQTQVDDVETRALGRVHLARTNSALKKLRAEQRRVLLAEIGEADALDGSRNRINVLRLRARLVLKAELGPWAPAAIALRVRSIRAAIERRVAEWGRDAHVVAASVASVAVAASLMIAGAGFDTDLEQQDLRLQGPEVFELVDIDNADLYPRVTPIRRPEPPSLSKTKDRAKRNAPGIRVCAVVCTRPEGPVEDALLDAGRRTNNAVKEADNAIREGDRQFRKEEKRVRRQLNDLP